MISALADHIARLVHFHTERQADTIKYTMLQC